ncbi:MAG: LysR family transcriptional regulator [Pseudomonadota bacterium]|uniref:LysR family transcriptional regulator n=1 Tax=Gallaecimonas pentaromativorans TaxID=584787 RepID=UPI00067E668C|nr:LysR family transcriptional regulator [Gallaecimonas pentaromativorans]MED5523745.1 LysR family transcriptional regulator [Pseudomonadota bacterium]
MDIKQLKFLIALDQTRHFGKAAELCHVTQPTLSTRISGLEDELDLTLVRRGHRFEGFTEAGERILAWAKTLLAAHDGLQAEAANFRGQLVGNLRIGMVPLSSFDPMLLLKPLSERYPELSFQLSALSSEQIIDGLGRNHLDLGLCYLEHINLEQFEVLELAQTSMGLLFDSRYFQFTQEALSWQEACEVPLGMLSKTMHFRQSITARLRSEGLDPQPVMESDSTFHLVQAVRAGICCAIMPQHIGLESLSGDMRMLPIANAHTKAPIGLLRRLGEPSSALAEKCFEEARVLFGGQTS